MGLLNKTAQAPAAPVVVEDPSPLVADGTVEPSPNLAPESDVTSAEAQPASEAAPAADTDALLSMFHEADSGAADRELIVSMAGEVGLPDLIDQLRIVSAALRVSVREAA